MSAVPREHADHVSLTFTRRIEKPGPEINMLTIRAAACMGKQ
jgi:hypothetical protein